MARLRLGYTKSRTGCLRCKQRRVKVCSLPAPPFHPDSLEMNTRPLTHPSAAVRRDKTIVQSLPPPRHRMQSFHRATRPRPLPRQYRHTIPGLGAFPTAVIAPEEPAKTHQPETQASVPHARAVGICRPRPGRRAFPERLGTHRRRLPRRDVSDDARPVPIPDQVRDRSARGGHGRLGF